MSGIKEINITEALENKIDRSNWVKWKFSDLVENIVEKVTPKDSGLDHYIGLEHLDSGSLKIRRFGETASLMSEVFWKRAIEISVGSLSPTINWKVIAKQEFFLPPKDQQAELAELLWALDEVIENTDSIKHRLNLTKRGILKDLFNLNWSSKTPFLNSLSYNKFELKKFSEICSESMFGPRFSSKQYDENGSIACLRTTDMDLEGNINLETMPRATLPKGKFREHYLKVNDILISRSGTCGLTGVFKGFEIPVLPAAFIIRFRMKEDINSDYIRIFFNSEYGKTITSGLASGAVQKNLTSKALLNVRIPIPEKSIQDSIIDMLNNLGLENCKSKIDSSKSLQKSLINQIF